MNHWEIADLIVQEFRSQGWRAEKEVLFSPRRIDVLAISVGGRDIVAFEIKTNLADFKNELKNPLKRQTVMQYCTQFYFVVPFGLLNENEVPPDSGLIYFCEEIHRNYTEFEFLIATPAKRKQRWLPFEWSAWIKYQYESELADDACKDVLLGDPRWMQRRGLTPLRFQFDVGKAGLKIASVPQHHEIDWENMPFGSDFEGVFGL